METKFSLSQADRDYLRAFKKSGNHGLREFKRATILMFLDKGLTITEIEDLLDVGPNDDLAEKKRLLDFGLERGLTDDARSGQPAKYTTLRVIFVCGIIFARPLKRFDHPSWRTRERFS